MKTMIRWFLLALPLLSVWQRESRRPPQQTPARGQSPDQRFHGGNRLQLRHAAVQIDDQNADKHDAFLRRRREDGAPRIRPG